jgi:F-box-like
MSDSINFDLDTATSHNDELPDAVKRVVHWLLFDAKRDLALIDAESDRVSPIPDALRFRRAQVEAQVISYQTAIAPHRRLPPEVLCEIFMQDASEGLKLPTRLPYVNQPLQWNVSHVCSKWRRIVLETPDLWACFEILYRAHRSSVLHISTTQLVTEILQRTPVSPITMDFYLPSFVQLADHHDPVSSCVVAHADRLRNLRIAATSDTLKPLFTLPPGSVDMLEELDVKYWGNQFQYPITVFEGAPHLRSVSLFLANNYWPIIDIFAFRFPWSQLVRLKLWAVNITSSTALILLQCCPSLEDCQLPTIGNPSLEPPNSLLPSNVMLSSMKSLEILFQVEPASESRHWLGRFMFPNLITLILGGRGWSWDPSLTNVITSAKRLKNLEMRLPIPAVDVEAILITGQLLETLHLSDLTVSSTTLDMISRGAYLPRLKNLLCTVTEDNLGDHFETIEKRRHLASVSDVEEVVFWLGTDDELFGKEREDTFQSEGCDVRVYRRLKTTRRRAHNYNHDTPGHPSGT